MVFVLVLNFFPFLWGCGTGSDILVSILGWREGGVITLRLFLDSVQDTKAHPFLLLIL